MSIATEIAVPCAAPATAKQDDPWNHVVDVRAAPARPDAESGPERASERVDEQQQDDDGYGDDQKRHGRVAHHVQEVAP
jgi:hypothetical protein